MRMLALCALLLCACPSGLPVVNTGVPLTDADLAMAWAKPENRKADDFAEQIVVRGNLDGGATFYARLTVTNLASMDGRADLTVTVTLADGRKLRFREKRDRDEWRYEKDRFLAEVGDGVIELGVGRASIVATTEEFELEATVSSTLAPLRPAGGVVRRAAGYYVTTIPIARGAIHVKLKVLSAPEEPEPEEPETPAETTDAPPTQTPEGTPEVAAEVAPPSEAEPAAAPTESVPDDEEYPLELELDGVAYVEHRAGTIPPYALAHRWHNMIDIGEERTVVISAFEHAKAKGQNGVAKKDPVLQGWVFAAEDDGYAVYEPELDVRVRDWSTDEKTQYPTPGLVFVSDPERRSFEGVIQMNALSERKDDLGSLKKLERLVVRRYMKPWSFRYDRAKYLFRKQNLEQPMIEVRGAARFQYQQLNE